MEDIDFFETINQELKKGYGFIPLIGSGISYQSGIMLGSDIINYLGYIYDCFFLSKNNRIDLDIDGWPEIPTEYEVEGSIKRITKFYKEECAKFSVHIRGNTNLTIKDLDQTSVFHPSNIANLLETYLARPLCPDIIPWRNSQDLRSHDKDTINILKNLTGHPIKQWDRIYGNYPIVDQNIIKELGLRSLHSWISALNFLSRLKYDYDQNRFTLLGDENTNIIDRFNAKITESGSPNQNHYLLAHLCRPLFIKKIISTNFDKLMESALIESRIDHRTIPLEKGSILPKASALHETITLIKLHGEMHLTRADESIHDLPNAKDRSIFFNYFFPHDTKNHLHQSHLLVLGSSLSDQRITDLIRHVLAIRTDFKVFVVCTSVHSRKRTIKTLGEKYKNQLIFSKPQNSEYVLYELYQRITLSLPPGGVYYRYVQYVPPVYEINDSTAESNRESEIVSYLSNLCRNHIHKEENSHNYRIFEQYGGAISENIITMYCEQNLTKIGANLFKNLSDSRFRCLWFELEDFYDTHDFVSALIQSMLNETGKLYQESIGISIETKQSTSKNSSKEDLDRNHLKSIFRTYLELINTPSSKWIFFIYGRHEAGECAGISSNNKWIDAEYEKLTTLIITLKELGFKIILMTKPEDIKKENYIKKLHPDHNFQENLYDTNTQEISLSEKTIKSISIKISERTKNWLENYDKSRLNFESDDWNYLRFLYACTLFRESRHVNALISEATLPCLHKYNIDYIDNDERRMIKVTPWIEELKRDGFFLKKEGGYLWMCNKVKKGIEHEFSEKLEQELPGKPEKEHTKIYNSIRARTHYWIGDWYKKAFIATKHSTPLIEAIYHWFRCIDHINSAIPFHIHKAFHNRRHPVKFNIKEEKEIFKYRCYLLLKTLTSISRLLKLSRTKIPCWSNGDYNRHLFEIFGEENSSKKNPVKAGNQKIEDILDLKEIFKNFRQKTEEKTETILYKLLVDKNNIDNKIFNEYKVKIKNATLEMLIDLNYYNIYNGNSTPYSITGLLNNDYPAFIEKDKSDEHYESNKFLFYNSINNYTAASQQEETFQKIFSISGNPSEDKNSFSEIISKIITKSDDFIKNLYPEDTKDNLLKALKIDSLKEKTIKLSVGYFLETGEDFRTNIKDVKNILLQSNLKGNLSAIYTIKLISHISYHLVRTAKCAGIIYQIKKSEFNKEDEKEHNRILEIYKRYELKWWALVTAFTSIGLSLTKTLPSSLVMLEIKVSMELHTLYGLALGRLNRFKEAHRHLNEAESYKFTLDYASFLVNHTAISIRRAEVYLQKSKLVFDQPEALGEYTEKDITAFYKDSSIRERAFIQYLERAYDTLQQCKPYLVSKEITSFWRDRYHLLHLRIFCVYLKRAANLETFTPYFISKSPTIMGTLYSIFNRGLSEVRGDNHRTALYWLYFLHALHHSRNQFPKDLDRYHSQLDRLLSNYRFHQNKHSKPFKKSLKNAVIRNKKKRKSIVNIIFSKSKNYAKKLDNKLKHRYNINK